MKAVSMAGNSCSSSSVSIRDAFPFVIVGDVGLLVTPVSADELHTGGTPVSMCEDRMATPVCVGGDMGGDMTHGTGENRSYSDVSRLSFFSS